MQLLLDLKNDRFMSKVTNIMSLKINIRIIRLTHCLKCLGDTRYGNLTYASARDQITHLPVPLVENYLMLKTYGFDKSDLICVHIINSKH